VVNNEELQQLVDLARRRHSPSLGRIYDLYFDRIYRYVLVRVGNAAEAEDLAAQTFLRLVERIETFDGRKNGFSGWLFTIAHNLVIDWSRRHKPLAELSMEQPSGEKGPGELIDERESVRRALSAIKDLNENQRQVLLLRLVGGLSCRETGEILELTEGNVRAIQHRGLKRVREKLEATANV
jgi:RNA polymerase sigma-70 factor, ECF subfamily